MKLVIDASVSVKWFFSDSSQEQDVAIALDILKSVQSGECSVVQPVHWLIETFAVIARKSSKKAASRALEIIHALDFDIVDDISILEKACIFSQDYRHHLFDTLYHAVAYDQKAVLITSDEKYFKKARSAGQIVLLKDFPECISTRL